MKINIKETIERTDTGDIVKLEFDQFQYYIKFHLTDNMEKSYEVRIYDYDSFDSIILYASDNLHSAISFTRKHINLEVIKYLKDHYGVEL
jgi:hypothetical protein